MATLSPSAPNLDSSFRREGSPGDLGLCRNEPHEIGEPESVRDLRAVTNSRDEEQLLRHPIIPIHNAPIRSRKIPVSEWKRVRPILTQLYLEQEMKLKDIISFMSEEHSFEAT